MDRLPVFYAVRGIVMFACFWPLVGCGGAESSRNELSLPPPAPLASTPEDVEMPPVAPPQAEVAETPPRAIVRAVKPLVMTELNCTAGDATATSSTPLMDALVIDVEQRDRQPTKPPPRPLSREDLAPLARSEEMNIVAERAAACVMRGFSLAERGAVYTARVEFLQALRLISQALDAQRGSQLLHGEALAAGLRALEEAEHFIPRGTRLEADLDLQALIAAHRTPILHDADFAKLSPLMAQHRYFTFAQEQLGLSVLDEPAGSMALYGLAKLHSVAAQRQDTHLTAAEPKAMVFAQAALLAHGDNYMAANEAAVLLARHGKLSTARALLERHAQTNAEPMLWQNLSAVHRLLGEHELAAAASRQAHALAERLRATSAATASQRYAVKWVEPRQFAESARPATDQPNTPALAPNTPPTRGATHTAERSGWSIFGTKR